MCPFCSGMRYKLEAWEKDRTANPCSCAACSNADSPWRQASKSPSDHRGAVTCGKIPHRGLELPSQPSVTPEFVHLKCSTLPKTHKVDGEEVSYTYPEHINPCEQCGWGKIAPSDCAYAASNEPVTWTEKQDGMGPDGEAIYCDYIGTRRELVEAIQRDSPQVDLVRGVHNIHKILSLSYNYIY